MALSPDPSAAALFELRPLSAGALAAVVAHDAAHDAALEEAEVTSESTDTKETDKQ